MKRFSLFFAILSVTMSAWADVPRLITYQGKLTGVSGPVDLTLRFHNAAAGGSLLFEETHTGVPLTAGVFALSIGQVAGGVPDSALDAGEVWLGLSVNGGTELAPRTRLVMVPFAAKAKAAELLVIPDTFETAVTVGDTGNIGIGLSAQSAQRLFVTAESGYECAIRGESDVRGVLGLATGDGTGVVGIAENYGHGIFGDVSGNGAAVFGFARGTEGEKYGVRGYTESPDGYGGYFEGRGYFSGNVGIGTPEPSATLHLASDIGDTSLLLTNDFDNQYDQHIHFKDTESDWYLGNLWIGENPNGFGIGRSSEKHDFVIDPNGHVGIGTWFPDARLDLTFFSPTDANKAVEFDWQGAGASRFDIVRNSTQNGQSVRTFRIDRHNDYDVYTSFSLGMVTNHPLSFMTNDSERMRITESGNVGIGTTAPQSPLHVTGAGSSCCNLSPGVHVGNDTAGIPRIELVGEGGIPYIDFRNGADPDFDARIILSGNDLLSVKGATLAVDVLEINGGADLAERFEVKGGDETSRTIEPGMVVSIDPAHPGDLMLASESYDRKVAGVISGANGLSPGMILQAEGNALASGEHPVALSGRVWVWCDASYGAIHPGDRLTTSSTPGHAMKVTDGFRADGAVIGKAMTGLNEGSGLVLLLVQPQ